jgi:hypothetical protein
VLNEPNQDWMMIQSTLDFLAQRPLDVVHDFSVPWTSSQDQKCERVVLTWVPVARIP